MATGESLVKKLVRALDKIGTDVYSLFQSISNLTTTAVPEGTRLYYTNTRAINSILTSLTAQAAAPVNNEDTVVTAVQKLQAQISANPYTKEIHVNADTGLDTNPGTYALPLKTLTQAASMCTASCVIILHAGVYTQSIAIAQSDVSIQALSSNKNTVYIQATLTLDQSAASSLVVSGIKIDKLIAQNQSTVLVHDCEVLELDKTSSGRVLFIDSLLQNASAVSITGAGEVSFKQSTASNININNAAAQVNVFGCENISNTIVTSGALTVDASVLKSTTALAAVTGLQPSTLKITNSTVYDQNNALGKVVALGNYTLSNVALDKTASTLTGTEIKQTAWSGALGLINPSTTITAKNALVLDESGLVKAQELILPEHTFESVSQNLKAFNYTINRVAGVVVSKTWSLPESLSITKTIVKSTVTLDSEDSSFHYSESKVTSLVLSGTGLPAGITKVTKSFTYGLVQDSLGNYSAVVTGVSYSV